MISPGNPPAAPSDTCPMQIALNNAPGANRRHTFWCVAPPLPWLLIGCENEQQARQMYLNAVNRANADALNASALAAGSNVPPATTPHVFVVRV
jgi:hypothetical protein